MNIFDHVRDVFPFFVGYTSYEYLFMFKILEFVYFSKLYLLFFIENGKCKMYKKMQISETETESKSFRFFNFGHDYRIV